MDGVTDSTDMSLSKLWAMVKDREALAYCGPWGCRELDVSERLNNNSDLLLSVGVQDGSLLVLLSVINTEMA